MNLMHIFATNVKKYRIEKGLSQEALAELAGLHRTYVSAVERERRNISIDNIENIANALNIDAYITTNVGTAKLRDGSVYLNPEYVNITTSLKRNRESIENELPIPPFSPFKD